MTTHHVKDMRANTKYSTCGVLLLALANRPQRQDYITPRWIDVDCPACLARKPSLFEALTALRDRLEDRARWDDGGGAYAMGQDAATERIVEDIDQILAAYAEESRR